ncbi:M55 family metallopeptidase [Fusibacter ferrireducens]|uniref:M55 family metallopeptidase n=1 Tax=Fusibacter ferrireducens TaxID=2785058 RepID=A0ABR9ZRS0_9FIRM|nr:M55 family metallopeptidase [Fusibacter ferrireducens]MBF4692329.1 M55 family metallopeptidase [Fusibacter ferrireducens]
MKVFLSTDIEGVCGTTRAEEVLSGQLSYTASTKQMTQEVNAACIGAKNAGATHIVVKDSHELGTNIDPNGLIEDAVLIRGWSGTPEFMMYGLDDSFDAAIYIGYHSAAMVQGNPLSHTANGRKIVETKLNGEIFSEFTLCMYTAAYYGVPSVFISGDKVLCEAAKSQVPNISTVAVKDGWGGATINMSPRKAVHLIQSEVEKVLKSDYKGSIPDMPSEFQLDITFKMAVDAVKMSHFPGAKLKSDFTVNFTTNDFYELMRFFLFAA